MTLGASQGQGNKRVLQGPINSHRLMIRAVKEGCDARGLEFASHSQGWILEIAKGDQRRFIYGYDFGLNRSATFQLMNDKAGFADACARAGIAAVPHAVFLHPRLQGYVPGDGNWPAMREAFECWGADIVVKNNAGTGGMEVMRVRSAKALEQAAFTLFQVARSLCISPFLPLKREIRVVMVAGEVLLTYEKHRTQLYGDGKAPLSALIAEAGFDLGDIGTEPVDAATGAALNLFDIPADGQAVLLDWRHNLGQGAVPLLIDVADEPEALALARKTQAALDLQMASIDVVLTPDGWQVLEANSGIMLEHLTQVLDPEATFAKKIYGAALDALF